MKLKNISVRNRVCGTVRRELSISHLVKSRVWRKATWSLFSFVDERVDIFVLVPLKADVKDETDL